jgi:hypothetical protein
MFKYLFPLYVLITSMNPASAEAQRCGRQKYLTYINIT